MDESEAIKIMVYGDFSHINLGGYG
jgi:hypothetical protein